MGASTKIIELRQLLAERGLATVAPARDRFAAGWPDLDQELGGGFPKGNVIELHSPHAGNALAVARLIQAAEQTRYFVGLVDGADGFDPVSVAPEALFRMLWVRCHSASQAVKAADLLLRDGNLPLVLMDLHGCADAAKIPSQNWYRLQRIVEQSGAVLLAMTTRPMIPSARVRVAMEARFTLEDIEREPAELFAQLQLKAGRLQGMREEETELLAAAG